MNIYVIGDSISMHYGPYLEELCSGKYGYGRKNGSEGYDNLDIPKGANGGDSAMVRKFVERQGENGAFGYDTVLLNCGLHDVKRLDGDYQVDIKEYKNNLKALAKLFKEKGVKIVWVRTTPVFDAVHNAYNRSFQRYDADVQSYNAAADEIMKENAAGIIDLYGFTMPYLPGGYIDHVHFNDDIRKKQAGFIFGKLQEILKG